MLADRGLDAEMVCQHIQDQEAEDRRLDRLGMFD